MDVSSLQFLGFALAAAVCYNLFRPLLWRQCILLLANLIFLSAISRDWRVFVPLVLFLALGYASLRLMARWKSSIALATVVAGVILVFVYLKQYKFLPASTFLPFPYVTAGLSYIFFRVLHLIVDSRDNAVNGATITPLAYLNYTLNFTTFVAGPIQLYPDFGASQNSVIRPPLTLAGVAVAAERIVVGFVKLRVLSMIVDVFHGAAIHSLSAAQPLAPRLITAAAVAMLYPVYLYLNFSGYVDLVVGVARLFRLVLPENFNRPFSSTSFIDFWSRWHITLSSWLKMYVYSPLLKALMSRFESPALAPFLGVLAFFVTFFLVGAWHGQTSEFLFFGVLQGLGVSLNKLYQVLMIQWVGRKRFKQREGNALYVAAARGLTFTYFGFTLIWFWSNWTQIHLLAGALTTAQQLLMWVGIWLASSVVLDVWERLRAFVLSFERNKVPILLAWPVRLAWGGYLVILSSTMLSFVNVGTPVLYQIF